MSSPKRLKTFIRDEWEKLDLHTKTNHITMHDFIREVYAFLLQLLKKYDTKQNSTTFMQAFFSVTSQQPFTREEAKKALDTLMQSIDVLEQQTLRIYLLYYLHAKANRELLHTMITRGITNNKLLLEKGEDDAMYAVIWGTKSPRRNLKKELKECHTQVQKLLNSST